MIEITYKDWYPPHERKTIKCTGPIEIQAVEYLDLKVIDWGTGRVIAFAEVIYSIREVK